MITRQLEIRTTFGYKRELTDPNSVPSTALRQYIIEEVRTTKNFDEEIIMLIKHGINQPHTPGFQMAEKGVDKEASKTNKSTCT